MRLDTATDDRALWTTILAEITAATPGADPAVQVLARLGDGSGLLVLDNLDTPWNADGVTAEEALARLADAVGVRVVASIRGTAWPGRVDWQRLPTLEALPRDKACELFLKIAGDGFADDPDLDAIVTALDGLPLAIDLLARQAQGSRTLGALRADFEERKGKLFELGEGKELSLKASLQLSLDTPKMTGAGKRLFTTLGRLPAGAAQQDLNKLIAGGGQSAGRVLCQLGLAFDDSDRLRMLAPIREHAALRPMQDVNAIVKHYLDLARIEGARIGGGGGAEAIARLSPEIANVEAAVELTIQQRQTAKAFAAFAGFARLLSFTGIGSPRPLERLLATADRKLDGPSRAQYRYRLGLLALARTQHDVAGQHFTAAFGLFREDANMPGQAECEFYFGQIALARSRHDEAEVHIAEALGLAQNSGAKLTEANCTHSFGEIAIRRSQHNKAHQSFTRARDLYSKFDDVLGEANCIRSLGTLALRSSQDGEAAKQFSTALELFRKVGSVTGQANCIQGLGEIALGRSQHDEARERFEEALALHRKVGNVNGEVSSMAGFGELARKRGQHAAAKGHFATALALSRQIDERVGEAMCLLGMGQIALALGLDDAEPQLRQALSLFEQVEHLEGRGRALLELAELAEGIGEKRRLLLDALDSHQRFGNPRWIGEAHRRLARLSEGEERDRHVAAARAAWAPIDRPDLLAELDSEINPSMQTPQQK